MKRDTTHRDKPESYRKCYRCRNRNRQHLHWTRPGCHSSESVTGCPLHMSRCMSPRKPKNPSCRQLKDDNKNGRCQRYNNNNTYIFSSAITSCATSRRLQRCLHISKATSTSTATTTYVFPFCLFVFCFDCVIDHVVVVAAAAAVAVALLRNDCFKA